MATLSQHRRRPVFQPLDLRDVPVAAVVAKFEQAKKHLASLPNGSAMQRPEHEAIAFYMMNAFVAEVGQRVDADADLGTYEQLVEDYQAVVRAAALRMFNYLLLICTRESRHVYNDATLFDALDARYGCAAFTKSLRSAGSSGAVTHLLKHPPKVNMGAYTDHLVAVFSEGSFNSQYGGAPWASIASVLQRFVHGVISPELMLDTGFTLAHNNGPIFNKDMLYLPYDSYELTRILDVQRAGQIPQLVDSNISLLITNLHRTMHKRAREVLGDVVCGPVDWLRVVELGAVQSYAVEVAAQKQSTQHTQLKGFVKTVSGAPSVVAMAHNTYAMTTQRSAA